MDLPTAHSTGLVDWIARRSAPTPRAHTPWPRRTFPTQTHQIVSTGRSGHYQASSADTHFRLDRFGHSKFQFRPQIRGMRVWTFAASASDSLGPPFPCLEPSALMPLSPAHRLPAFKPKSAAHRTSNGHRDGQEDAREEKECTWAW